MKDIVEVAGLSVQPGHKAEAVWPVGERLGGEPVTLPVIVYNGARPGPTVWVQAGSHGDEYHSMAAVLDLAAELDPQDMAGAVVLLPMVNPSAVPGLGATSVLDHQDLESQYPGRPGGSATQVLAATLLQEVTEVADYALDLHDGGAGLCVPPFVVYYGDELGKGRQLAVTFGARLLLEVPTKTQPSFYAQVSQRGVTAIHAEAGWGTRVNPEAVAVHVHGVKNVLATVGVLESWRPEVAADPVVLNVSEESRLRATRAGFARVYPDPGDFVEQGEPVVSVYNRFGVLLEELRAPVDGYLVDLLTRPVVSSGQLVAVLGVVANQPG